MARIVRITLEKIEVHQSEHYALIEGEAGKSAEWRLYFITHVGGKERRWTRWERSGIRDNTTYELDRQLDVMLDGELSIEVRASELDDSSSNDRIPGFKRTHSPEPGWEGAGTQYRKSRGDLDFNYTVHYRIQYIAEGATLTPGRGTLVDQRFSGLWDAGNRRVVSAMGRSAAQVTAQADALWKEGGRLLQLQPYVLPGGQVRYNLIWEFTGVRQLWNLDCDEAHFRKTTEETWSWGRPQQVIPFVVEGRVRYACLWNEGQHAQLWNVNTDEAGVRRNTADTRQWARPHQILAFVIGGELRYCGLWNAGQHRQVSDVNCSQEEAAKLGADNWSWARAHQIQPFTHQGRRRYSVLWNAGQHGQLWNLDCDELQVEANTEETAGWGRPRQIFALSQ